ncbi:MAG: GTP 3',8-cyclase MoaA [Clostridia bacterium]|nr:GTP 3',8-cyclase MoaA [Clostridia bacterium]
MKDGYGRNISYLRLSVTDLCNLRCRYCMPEEGVCKLAHDRLLTEDEMVTAVRAAAGLGITKVRITGGEPLVKPNILSICRRVAAVEGIAETDLTTNATRLPAMAQALREAGIRRVNISLDTLNAEKYAFITRRGVLAEAMEGIRAALAAGFDKVKINAVLIGGFNEDEVPALAELTRRWPVDMRFIELMPMPGDTLFGEQAYIPADRVLDMLPEAAPAAEHDGVARLYRLPGAMGNIGLISPLSSHFCGECNRLRLTADGHLKPCLHSREEICIKGLDEAGMTQAMREAIRMKPRQHDPLSRGEPSRAARQMNQIGG